MTDRDEIRELEVLASELKARLEQRAAPARWNADPADVRRSVMQLVLTLVDFIRQVLERQALRRVDQGTLTPDEIERVGVALMQLEETVHDLARQAGLDPKDLNLDLGPLGKLT
jgi:Gas vesicle protein K